MSGIDSAINIDDLKRLAKRRLPKIMFDFIEGGAEDEVGLSHQRQRVSKSPARPALLRRYLQAGAAGNIVRPAPMPVPFGIAPTGMAGAFRRDAELYLSRRRRRRTSPI